MPLPQPPTAPRTLMRITKKSAMELPPEIRDHIICQISRYDVNDWYTWEKDRYGDVVSEDNPEAQRKSPLYYERPDLSVLLKLRLVSNAWNITASRFLRNYFWWPLNFSSTNQLQRSLACCGPENDALFRKVKMKDLFEAATFQRWFKFDPQWPEEDGSWVHSFMASHIYEDKLLPRADGGPPDFHLDKSIEHGLIRDIFGSLKGISVFHLSFPPSFITFHHDDSVLCYDFKAIEEIFTTVQVAFKTNTLQHLVDLRLDLPCTRDVARLADAMTTDAYQRLKHLRIHIMDETGVDGSYLTQGFTWPGLIRGLLNGDSEYDTLPPSNLQERFPNKSHQGAVWDFVASCPNLESLGIKGTQFLDLGQLCWKKSHISRGLQHLSLRRIWASISSIIELLNPYDNGHLPTVECIDLNDVKIYGDDGDWSELFIHLRENCPNLVNLKVFQLTYFDDHRNFNIKRSDWHTQHVLWTKSKKDWETLRELKGHLVAKVDGDYPQVCNADNILDEEFLDDEYYGLD